MQCYSNMTTAIAFVSHFKVWDVQLATAAQLTARLQAEWGNHTMAEHLNPVDNPDQQVIPFFDFDKILHGPPPDLREYQDVCDAAIQAMFGHDPNFSFEQQVLRGWRHGVIQGGYKVSFRYFVRGYRIKLAHIPHLIQECSAEHLKKLWDESVYSSKRNMSLPGSFKAHDDRRVFQVEQPDRLQEYIIQHLSGDEIRLDFQDCDTQKHFLSRPPPASWEGVVPRLEAAGFIRPTCVGERESSLTFTAGNLGQECPCCGLTHTRQNWWVGQEPDGRLKVKSYSSRCKMLMVGQPNAVILSEPNCLQTLLANIGLDCPVHNRDGSPVDFSMAWPTCMTVRQHLEVCPACKGRHGDDCYLIETLVSKCCTVRNVDSTCHSRLLISVIEDWPPKLRQIIKTPYADSAFADLFLEEHQQRYISDGQTMYEFDGNRWKPLSGDKMKNTIESWLQKLLDIMSTLLAREGDLVPLHHRKQVNKAMSHVKAESGIHNIVKSAKRKMIMEDLGAKMDTDPFLLGADNCVIDLRTGKVRQGLPGDLISKSVGYSIPYLDSELEDDKMEQVAACMSRIYPIEAERAVAQTYGGYCLLGDHPAKRVVLCTDAGGERAGNNAKSTFAKLLAEVLGPEYAMKGKNAFLYKTDSNHETADSHNAGLLAHRGCRFAYYEELDPKRRLNNGLLKDIHGGNSVQQGRGVGEKDTVQFTWITKQMLIFNGGSLPSFDFSDTALIDRMIVLQHRSKFCTSDEEYQADRGQEHTYMADPDMASKMRELKPYTLRWFLEGLQRYHTGGFNHLPQQCLAWKDALIRNHDTVGTFVVDCLQKTGQDSDCVQRSQLYQMYRDMYPEERNPKTSLGKHKWFDQMKKRMGGDSDSGFFQQKKIKLIPKRDVWLGWKMNEDI